MIKYAYKDINWDQDQNLENHLLIGTLEDIPDPIPPEKAILIKDILFPDGSVAFRVVRTKN